MNADVDSFVDLNYDDNDDDDNENDDDEEEEDDNYCTTTLIMIITDCNNAFFCRDGFIILMLISGLSLCAGVVAFSLIGFYADQRAIHIENAVFAGTFIQG